jgi:hypothetical protein
MRVVENIWILGGALIIFFASMLTVFGPSIEYLRPPYIQVIFGWMFSYLGLAILPIIYSLEFWIIQKSTHYNKIILILVLFVSLLNFAEIYYFWDFSIMVNGKDVVERVALVNGISFALLIVFSLFAVLKGSKRMLYSANLCLFILLSWIAFPYLGELI